MSGEAPVKNITGCRCAQALFRAEQGIRDKAKRNPELAIPYHQAALEVHRVAQAHFVGCVPCQAEQGGAA